MEESRESLRATESRQAHHGRVVKRPPFRTLFAVPVAPADAIELLLCDAERMVGARLTVHDHAGLLADRKGRSLMSIERLRHANPYCDLGRAAQPSWDGRCIAHCYGAAHDQAVRRLSPFWHRCWKGATELVVPIVRGHQVLAVIFAGVFRAPEATPPDTASLEHRRLPIAPDPGPVARIVLAVGERLVAIVDRAHAFDQSEPDRETQIRRFVHYNAQRQVGPNELGRALLLSASRARHLVRDIFGQSLSELLIEERLTRARLLLLTTSRSVGEIARQLGFVSEYYFNRLFKQRVGAPPGRYRDRVRGRSRATRTV